jgi:hypothetical protein
MDRRRIIDREKSQQSILNNLGLSEHEALEYVMMLSREEQGVQENLAPGGDGVFQLDKFHESLPSSPFSSTSPGTSLNFWGPTLQASSASSSVSGEDSSSASTANGSSYDRSSFTPNAPRYRDEHVQSGLEELDEEVQIQLALDLSLAEARSRGDINAESLVYM